MLKEVVGDRNEKRIRRKVGVEVLLALPGKIGLRLGLSWAQLKLMGGSRRRSVVEGNPSVMWRFMGYGTSLTQTAEVLNIAVQSVFRGVKRGEQEFKKRGWATADFLK